MSRNTILLLIGTVSFLLSPVLAFYIPYVGALVFLIGIALIITASLLMLIGKIRRASRKSVEKNIPTSTSNLQPSEAKTSNTEVVHSPRNGYKVVTLVFFLLGSALFIVGAVASNNTSPTVATNGGVAAVYGFIILVISATIAFYGSRSSCPSCHRWYAKKFIRRELLKSYQNWETVYETVTTNATTRNSDGSTSQASSSSQVPRTALVTHSDYLEYYQCKYCMKEWEKTKHLESY